MTCHLLRQELHDFVSVGLDGEIQRGAVVHVLFVHVTPAVHLHIRTTYAEKKRLEGQGRVGVSGACPQCLTSARQASTKPFCAARCRGVMSSWYPSLKAALRVRRFILLTFSRSQSAFPNLALCIMGVSVGRRKSGRYGRNATGAALPMSSGAREGRLLFKKLFRRR